MNTTNLDSPHWSWFHGCRKHRGQPAPCAECVRLRDPDVTQDGSQAFGVVAPLSTNEPYPGYNEAWNDYLEYLNGMNP